LNAGLATLDEWLKANKLNLHADKTKCMFIGTKQRINDISSNMKVVVDNHEITPSKKMKSLGVVLDPTLSWNCHFDQTISKIKSGLGALRHAKPFVDTLIQIYNSLIVQHLITVQKFGVI